MDKYIQIFRALGDSTRLQIVQMLSSGEMCACKILERFQITQPTLSHHMKILCDSGLILRVRKVNGHIIPLSRSSFLFSGLYIIA